MSATMAEKIAATKKAKIAVVDFTNLRGDVTELGRFIAEEFSVALVNNSTGKGFKVVDRIHLKSIIKEHKLSEKGLIDTARKLSKFAGVDALITGTLTSVGDRVRIIVKILDISTAETVDAISGYIASTDTVKNLLATNIIFRQGVLIEPKEGNTGQSPRQSVQTVKAGGFLFQPVEGKFSDGNLILSFLTISP
ncbi:MAG: FlgO family outer membrane protein [Candidatus Electrothrix gigas]